MENKFDDWQLGSNVNNLGFCSSKSLEIKEMISNTLYSFLWGAKEIIIVLLIIIIGIVIAERKMKNDKR